LFLGFGMMRSRKVRVDEAAIDPQQWLDRHGDYLYRYALAKTRRGDVAEDLVQETLLAAWRGRHTFAGAARERTWLTAILKRKIVDHLRRVVRDRARERARQADAQTDRWLDRQFTGWGKWRRRPEPWTAATPEGEAQRAEFWRVLEHCTDKLPHRLRDVFVLWHLDNRAAGEVRAALAVSPSNLWVMLHRARLRLWRCLTIHWYGADATAPEGA
jgi:RNA polymerase sigma-70 factor (ECF subfamily)